MVGQGPIWENFLKGLFMARQLFGWSPHYPEQSLKASQNNPIMLGTFMVIAHV
jgi:hypothetical protein